MHVRRWLLTGLIVFEALLVFIYCMYHWLEPPFDKLYLWFDLDGEATIPAWFSSSQLLLTGSILCAVAHFQARADAPSRSLLLLLGACFVLLSMDETARIHERIMIPFRDVPWLSRIGPGYGWMLAYASAGVLLLVLVRRDLRAVLRYHRSAALITTAGAAIYVTGGVVMEAIGWEFVAADASPVVRGVQIIVEEWLEMLGATIMLYGAIVFAGEKVRVVQVRRPDMLAQAAAPGRPVASRPGLERAGSG